MKRVSPRTFFLPRVNRKSQIVNSPESAFTLIELMMVVAIMVIAMAMCYPSFIKLVQRAPLTQGVMDVTEACRKARALAIIQDHPMELLIYPQDGRIEVASASVASDSGAPATPSPTVAAISPTTVSRAAAARAAAAAEVEPPPQPAMGFSAHLSDQVQIEMVDVNFIEYKDADVARVRFYPNGTSDEFTIVLHSEDQWRKITLEVVTALAQVEAIK